MKNAKSIFASKTFWLNAIMGILAITAIIDPAFLSSFGIAPDNQVQVLQVIGAVTAILNVILRIVTSQPVTLKK